MINLPADDLFFSISLELASRGLNLSFFSFLHTFFDKEACFEPIPSFLPDLNPSGLSFLPSVQGVMKCFKLSFVFLVVSQFSAALFVPESNGLLARQVSLLRPLTPIPIADPTRLRRTIKPAATTTGKTTTGIITTGITTTVVMGMAALRLHSVSLFLLPSVLSMC